MGKYEYLTQNKYYIHTHMYTLLTRARKQQVIGVSVTLCDIPDIYNASSIKKMQTHNYTHTMIQTFVETLCKIVSKLEYTHTHVMLLLHKAWKTVQLVEFKAKRMLHNK